MSNSHINIEAEFFENHPNNQPSSLRSTADFPQHSLKLHQSRGANNTSIASGNQVQIAQSSSYNKFYQQYKRIISVSYNLGIQKERLKHVLAQLQGRIGKIQDKFTLESPTRTKEPKAAVLCKKEVNSEETRNKRARRTAEQIEKKFKCEATFCQRFYGSEGSLQQHIKLKHPEMANKDSQEEYIPYQNREPGHSST